MTLHDRLPSEFGLNLYIVTERCSCGYWYTSTCQTLSEAMAEARDAIEQHRRRNRFKK